MQEPTAESAQGGVAQGWKPPMPEISKATCGAALRRGFKETTQLCCPAEMEVYFTCLLESLGYERCSWPHIQGLMHWFTCVPDMDPQYVLDVIKNGNPCKFWTPKGEACPVLTPECQGHWCR